MQVKNGSKKGLAELLKSMQVGQRIAVIATAIIVVGGVGGAAIALSTQGAQTDADVTSSNVVPSSTIIETSSKTSSEASSEISSETSSEETSSETSSKTTSSNATTSSKANTTSSTKPATSSVPASSAPPSQDAIAALPEGYQEKFADLYKQNNDFVGWIKFTGKLDYPVAQSSDNSYYLNKTFTKGKSGWGNPYMDFRVNPGVSKNTVIYSHSNPKDGSMFQALKGLRKVDFYKQHPTITFNDVYSDGTYKIIAFFVEWTKGDVPFFPYHNFIDQTDPAYIDDYIANAKARSFINTTVDYTADDTFLTLSTCWDTNSANYDRLVCVARKVRPGEDASVDTSGATQNTAQQLPPNGLFNPTY